MHKQTKVIILTGPCGVGKTTIAKIIRQRTAIQLIDGDALKDKFFPNVAIITEHPEKLKQLKEAILELSQKHFLEGETVLIDYVILGRDYISRFQEVFGDNLIFKVILPSQEVIYQRDQDRACWTSGQLVIDQLYDKYLELKDLIGTDNYLDNSHESAEETATRILNCINY